MVEHFHKFLMSNCKEAKMDMLLTPRKLFGIVWTKSVLKDVEAILNDKTMSDSEKVEALTVFTGKINEWYDKEKIDDKYKELLEYYGSNFEIVPKFMPIKE